MKKLLTIFCLLFAALSAAQVPTTPNLHLNVPLHGTPNWDVYMNANMSALDNFLSGGAPLVNFKVTQYIDFAAISTPSSPPAGYCRAYFNVATGLIDGVNSLGASCAPTGSGGGGGSVVAPGAGTQIAYFPDGTVASVTGDPNTSLNGTGDASFNSVNTTGAGIGLVITDAFQIVPDVFSTLPTCDASIEGYVAPVTDSTSSILGDTVVGFGSQHVLAYCNATNWVVASTGAPIFASPAFTGTPTAPTAAVDTNTTQLATTQFVLGQAASATPLIDGSAAVGTSFRYARADHVHPTDTTRAPLASPTFTGTVTAPLTATTTNCASAGGTCAAASAGRVSIAAAATTVTVATTAVTANSEIFIQEDSTLGTALSVTCNTTTGRLYTVTTRTAGTSFVITASAAPAANPACLSYRIIN